MAAVAMAGVKKWLPEGEARVSFRGTAAIQNPPKNMKPWFFCFFLHQGKKKKVRLHQGKKKRTQLYQDNIKLPKSYNMLTSKQNDPSMRASFHSALTPAFDWRLRRAGRDLWLFCHIWYLVIYHLQLAAKMISRNTKKYLRLTYGQESKERTSDFLEKKILDGCSSDGRC